MGKLQPLPHFLCFAQTSQCIGVFTAKYTSGFLHARHTCWGHWRNDLFSLFTLTCNTQKVFIKYLFLRGGGWSFSGSYLTGWGTCSRLSCQRNCAGEGHRPLCACWNQLHTAPRTYESSDGETMAWQISTTIQSVKNTLPSLRKI